MPTITFSFKDLQNLVGKRLSIEEVQELAHYGKGDFEGYTEETDEIKIDFGDTNLPYLWSVEGFARLIKQVLNKQKGIAKIRIKKGDYSLSVDKSVKKVRPYIAAFVARGKAIDDYLIKQMIQLQEKLCENFGRRREKSAIGVYKLEKIKFPVKYKAVDPESVKFIPLDFRKEMTQQEILEEHPKGKEYAWILTGHKKYPILVDDEGGVLSFPPIINSDTTGKIEEGDKDIFFEVTGTDADSIMLCCNIFAQALYERGFTIYSVNVDYGDHRISTPNLRTYKTNVDKWMVKKVTGLDLTGVEFNKLLAKAGYGIQGKSVVVPHYRNDVLHPVDVIEDIAIMYGYDKIEAQDLKRYTIGNSSSFVRFINKIRDIMVGSGYQEVLSPILSNKEILYRQMETKDIGTVEIENFMSSNYAVVRSWLLPIMLSILARNKHVEYPQKLFEEGIVNRKVGGVVEESRRVVAVYSGEGVDYTTIRQQMDLVFNLLGIEHKVVEGEHKSFIGGRVACVIVKEKEVAILGEIHPKVLENFGIEMPVVGMEINLTELFGLFF